MTEQEAIQEFLTFARYDREAGRFYWSVKRSGVKYGAECGAINKQGYRRVSVRHREVLLHRVVFWLEHGYLPDIVEHKDRIKTNNHHSNLRKATHQQNMQNRGISKANTSGCTGVYWSGKSKKWFASICLNGKNKTLGHYEEFADAVTRRKQAEKEFYKEFQPV